MKKLGNRERAEFARRYFKTGPGEYAEGDIFLGLSASQMHHLAKQFCELTLSDIRTLLRSAIHEERMLALLVLVRRFAKSTEMEQKRIYNLYLRSARYVNNWDLVDVSAEKIIGPYLENRPKEILYSLAKSNNLWERRIAIMATFYFIKKGRFKETLRIARLLMKDKEDLIHKSTGWMLREIGKRNLSVEEEFLQKYCTLMPRTMLRYAIERFPPDRRRQYLIGKPEPFYGM